MNLRTFLFCAIFTTSTMSAFAQIRLDAGSSESSSKAAQRLSARLSDILRRYQMTDVPIGSDDYKFLYELKNQPELPRMVIDDLIRLTIVRQQVPETSEKHTAITYSPAGQILARIGMPAAAKINEALGDPFLDSWQLAVLKDVQRRIQQRPIDATTLLFENGRTPDDLYPRKSKQ
jgi:hypothetical protein